jgi:hypothetical protein
MQDVNLKLRTTFATRMRVPMVVDFESSMEWKLYDSIAKFFNPLKILATAIPYKFNQ